QPQRRTFAGNERGLAVRRARGGDAGGGRAGIRGAVWADGVSPPPESQPARPGRGGAGGLGSRPPQSRRERAARGAKTPDGAGHWQAMDGVFAKRRREGTITRDLA